MLTTLFFFFRMKSKVMGSSGKIRPVLPIFVHQEMLQRHNSMDSFSNMSIGDVSGVLNGNASSDLEKKLDYYPDLSYGAPDTKVVNNSSLLSSPSLSSPSSSASSITYPTPARTRQNSGIEVSSLHRDSSFVESINQPPTSTNSSESKPQPTDHSAVWWFKTLTKDWKLLKT